MVEKKPWEEQDAEKMLWDFLFKQDDYVIQEFFTAVIGIGALFFAYGSIHQFPYVQLAVALIGFGASLIVWMHAWGAHSQADALRGVIGETYAMERYKKVMEWRNTTWFRKYLYHPVTRLITYFSALVALTWALIIVMDFLNLAGIILSPYPFLTFGTLGIVVVLVMVAYRKGQDRGRYDKPNPPSRHYRLKMNSILGQVAV